MWKFQSRCCANGITQIRGSDLTESFFPIIIDFPVSSIMALAASWNIIGVLIDDTNYFQNKYFILMIYYTSQCHHITCSG